MLSIHRCRELLGPKCEFSDARLTQLRAELYGLAQTALRLFDEKRSGIASGKEETPLPRSRFAAAIAHLSADDRYVFEERAAIHQFEGGMSREDAEEQTLVDAAGAARFVRQAPATRKRRGTR